MENEAPQGAGKATELLMSGNAVVVVEHDADVEIEASTGGTRIFVLDGSYLVGNLASGGSVSLSSGREIYVPADTVAASHENMVTSVTSFDASSVVRWWTAAAGSPSSAAPYVVVAIGSVLIVAGLGAIPFT